MGGQATNKQHELREFMQDQLGNDFPILTFGVLYSRLKEYETVSNYC